MIGVIIELLVGIAFLGLYVLISETIDKKRLKEAQIAWDQYSKNLTYDERWEVHLDWIKKWKRKKGHNLYYFPDMVHVLPKYYKCRINGIEYRGTKEEISKESGVSIKLLNQFDILPKSLTIESVQGEPK